VLAHGSLRVHPVVALRIRGSRCGVHKRLDKLKSEVGVEPHNLLAATPGKLASALKPAPNNAGVQGENSTEMKASTYLEARRQLDVLRREVRKVFANVDLLVLPTLLSPPVTIAQGANPMP